MVKPRKFPEQTQDSPGSEQEMRPAPEIIRKSYRGSEKLKNKVARITGGDSGIGRSVAVHFAREGADVAIVYLEEDDDALETQEMVQEEGKRCLVLEGDIRKVPFCKNAIRKCKETLGGLNILVNNAAVQFPRDRVEQVKFKDVVVTFETNIYPFFYCVKEALRFLKKGDAIINTSSVTAYRGSKHLLDYSTTKGAIVSFTRSLALMLAKDQIRVNGVAPGPIWTPLIPSTFKKISDFGQDTPLGRAGQPSEVGPAFVFLACEDSSYMTGQFIHINGGEIING